jgi:hypothetical protein
VRRIEMRSADETIRLAVDAVGEDGIKRLAAAGLTVVPKLDLDAYEEEVEDGNERLKELARASMRASKLRSMLCEVYAVQDAAGNNGLRIVVCDPCGDEESTLKKVAGLMRWAADQPAKTGKRARRVNVRSPSSGTES